MGFRLSRDLAFSALPSAGERSGVRPAGAGVNDACRRKHVVGKNYALLDRLPLSDSPRQLVRQP